MRERTAVVALLMAALGGLWCSPERNGGETVAEMTGVTVGQGGRMIVNGEAFFPIGCYHLPGGDAPYRQLAEAGFNLAKGPAKKQDLDQAQAAGMVVWVSLSSTLDLSQKTDEQKAKIAAAVEAVGDHPALLVWESMDEPSWTWKQPGKPRATAEGLAAGHHYLKSLDPAHPIWINHAPRNLVKTLVNFSQGVDIVSCDIYPILPRDLGEMFAIQSDGTHGDLLNQTASAVGEYTRKMRRVAGRQRSVWMVLQGFSWEGLRKPEEQDPKKILYPSYAETRFMAYDAIINGANGILYWGTHYTPKPSQFWSDLTRVTRELAQMAPVFLAPAVGSPLQIDYHEMGFSKDDALEYTVRQHEARVYVIMANTSPYPARIDFSATGILKDAKTLRVLEENRTLNRGPRGFRDDFDGYAVHVYVVE